MQLSVCVLCSCKYIQNYKCLHNVSTSGLYEMFVTPSHLIYAGCHSNSKILCIAQKNLWLLSTGPGCTMQPLTFVSALYFYAPEFMMNLSTNTGTSTGCAHTCLLLLRDLLCPPELTDALSNKIINICFDRNQTNVNTLHTPKRLIFAKKERWQHLSV